MKKEMPLEKPEPMPQKDAQAPTPETTTDDAIRFVPLELVYDLRAQRLEIRAKASTILQYTILTEALEKIRVMAFDPRTPMPEDQTIRARFTLDTATDDVAVEAQCPRSLLKGIVMYAIGALTRNQISQHLALQTAKFEQRLAALELKLAEKGKALVHPLTGAPL